jgi:large subunit ribosomal protein L1
MSVRMKKARERIDATKDSYSLPDGLALVVQIAGECKLKFDETVEVALKLGVDPRQSNEQIRMAVQFPHGLGKVFRVAVFAEGDQAIAAEKAGADRVGMQDLADEMNQGKLDYDVVIAHQSCMSLVGKLGKVLGTKGLMPNPKVGTVAEQVGPAVQKAKAGQAQLRTDKAGIIHCPVGKVSFGAEKLLDNIKHLVDEIKRAKPASAKGVYLQGVVLATSMGPGVRVDAVSLR